ERDFDYGYAAVSSDDGRSWIALSGKSTTGTDPNGANYGEGFTGKTGGGQWIEEDVDLTPYVGRRVLLRFEMVTDDAYNGGGICLDSVRVDEIGWRDSGDGWQAEGFVRIANEVPQRVTARVVGVFGKEVRVLQVPIGPDGLGRLKLPDDIGSADRAALVVAAHTPLTNLA